LWSHHGAFVTANTIVLRSELQVVAGSDATALLHDRDFVREWERLAESCPWGTVYQSPAFAQTWYRVYQRDYEPLVVVARGNDGFDGLMLLARRGQQVVHVGAHQAEYHGWLARPETSATYLASAADALRTMGVGELRLHMAAPKLPLDSLHALEEIGMHATVRMHDRGFMRVGPGSDIDDSLRKKGNKSRIARLSRRAPLELVQLNTREELDEVFDTIIEQCDLRQGAMHNSLPFSSDDRKREFYLSMMEQPGLLHATVLRSGDRVVAAHLGPIDREYVSLGVIAHSPLDAAHSPGKLLLLYLGHYLGRQGFNVFDLTPGGVYKDRFADWHDEVPSVTLHLSAASYMKSRGRQIAVRSLRSAGDAVGFDARDIGARVLTVARRVARLTPAKVARTAAVVSKQWASSTREFRLYVMSNEEALSLDARSEDFGINRVSDLLKYEQTAGEPDVQGFLRLALQRLESGQFAFTTAHDGLLLHNSWLIPRTQSGGSEFGHRFYFANPVSVLWADFTHPAARGRGMHQASLRARAWYAARQRMASLVAIGVRADNIPSRHNIEKLGFNHVGSAFLRTKFGREERWIESDFITLEPRVQPSSAQGGDSAGTGTELTRERSEGGERSKSPSDGVQPMLERERTVQRVDERVGRNGVEGRDGERRNDDSTRL
jgi:CelD/BcsL family acetyltransferase involved in cellulose biosynthesis/RimJ/RimL family protein N-acetyltransferase